MNEIVLATSNAGKIMELQAILSPLQCISQTSLGIQSIEETGLSFVENALLKARHASKMSQKPALADDSGLIVKALQGKPGIYSARYAKEYASDLDNINYLLQNMQHIPTNKRQAWFYCAIVMVEHENDPTPIIACGQLAGMITDKPSGTHGFGYDPVFYLPSQQCTMAELPASIKNTISHRAKALSELRQQLLALSHDE